MHIINCTPHEIAIYSSDSTDHPSMVIPTSGHVVRMSQEPQSSAGWLAMSQLHAQGAQCSATELPAPTTTLAISEALVPVVTPQVFGSPIGLPEWAREPAEDGFPYALLVGVIGAERVAKEWPGPVFTTDTGPESAVRSSTGALIGVRRLIRICK